MKKILATTLVGALLTFTLPGSYADETPSDNKYTLDVNIPTSGSTTVGGRMFVNSEMAIEVMSNIQLDAKNGGVAGGTLISGGGGIMQYLSKGRVSPFLRAGGMLSLYFGDRYTGTDNNVRGYAGVGAEFMITKELSMRSSVNAVLDLSPFKLGTLTNNLSLSFFF